MIEDVGDRPWGIAVSSDGKKIYTANGPSADVSVIDVATSHRGTAYSHRRQPMGSRDQVGCSCS